MPPFEPPLPRQEHRRQAPGAAAEVGYDSPSQFSREFRRLFGQPPATHVRSLQEEGIAAV